MELPLSFRKKGLKKLLCGAVVFGLLFFISFAKAADISSETLLNIDIAQQNNFKTSNTSLVLKDSLINGQNERVIMAPTVSVLEKKKITEKVEDETNQENSPGRKETIEYIIKEGDTISGIAAIFGLKTQTLVWANGGIENINLIKPGNTITVPPKDGVIYTVKKGDTLSKIAQIYKTDIDEIRGWNQLDADKIVEGQEIFLPNATKPAPVVVKKTSNSTLSTTINSSQNTANSLPKTPVYSSSNGCHQFPYGYCTWYVAQKRCIPWGGNAKDWLSNAQAYGYNVCWGSDCNCPAGSILVTRESWYGHVAYVTGQNDNVITISEMNKVGFGKVSTRALNKGNWVIRGCIY
ncbi:MAG TPA: LysM peptidoglycan-binding domain-containing protein [Candidatus Pacearchaeota archaeon]|nr:LysM peptidoglycan-binding domain-containing protein [Candidatus Pacearchaeota archaeon]